MKKNRNEGTRSKGVKRGKYRQGKMEGVVEGKRCKNSSLGLKITILKEFSFTQS